MNEMNEKKAFFSSADALFFVLFACYSAVREELLLPTHSSYCAQMYSLYQGGGGGGAYFSF